MPKKLTIPPCELDVAEHAIGVTNAGVGGAEDDGRMIRIELVVIGCESRWRAEDVRDEGQLGGEFRVSHVGSF